MGISLDFTNVPDNAVVPKATYNAVVFNIEQKYSNAGGNPYLNWHMKIQGGEFNGRIVYDTTSLQPQALWKLKNHLKALDPEMDMSGQLSLDTDALLGLPCRIVVDHQMYEGEPKARVKSILKADNSVDGGDDVPDFLK